MKEQLVEEYERWRQAALGADDGRKELVQLLYQQSLLQKLFSHADGAWQAVHVFGDAVHVVRDTVGVCHVAAGGVLVVVWVCDHGAHSGCGDDDSESYREVDFAAN